MLLWFCLKVSQSVFHIRLINLSKCSWKLRACPTLNAKLKFQMRNWEKFFQHLW
jgi:hypothetical protein